MLETYELGGERVDALDIKCMLVRAGMRYPEPVYSAVEGKARLESPFNPFACNCVILPGDVAVHLNQNDTSPFALDLDADGDVCLFYEGARLFPVTFPPPGLDYYRQARQEFARLYKQYALNPPGIPAGSHVSLCHDIYRNMDELLASVRGTGDETRFSSPTRIITSSWIRGETARFAIDQKFNFRCQADDPSGYSFIFLNCHSGMAQMMSMM